MVPVATDGGRGLGHSVARSHLDATAVDELLNGGWYEGTGGGEEVGVLQTQCLLQQGDDGLLVELITKLQRQWRKQAAHLVVHIVFLAHSQRVEHQFTLHAVAGGDFLLDT